jgi:hypothetical protein
MPGTPLRFFNWRLASINVLSKTALADGGVIDPENVKWKVAKAEDRKALVAKRHAEGANNCEIARELGVDEGTIRNDLKSENSEKNSENSEVVTAEGGRFETIVIDPPWPMVKIARDVRPNQAEFDYRTMSADELRDFAASVKSMAADDCHLFMWTTQKYLPLAMELIALYGFRYTVTMVWHKAGGYQHA